MQTATNRMRVQQCRGSSPTLVVSYRRGSCARRTPRSRRWPGTQRDRARRTERGSVVHRTVLGEQLGELVVERAVRTIRVAAHQVDDLILIDESPRRWRQLFGVVTARLLTYRRFHRVICPPKRFVQRREDQVQRWEARRNTSWTGAPLSKRANRASPRDWDHRFGRTPRALHSSPW
jgi:hypothetical protein